MRGVRLHVLIGLAALSVVAAACGSDANDASSGGGSTGASSTGSTGCGGMMGGNLYGGGGGGRYGNSEEMTGATGSTGGAGAKADVSASVNNYVFMPKTVKVHSGDTLEVRNDNTKTPHTFTVVGEDVDLELAPQTSESTKIDLEPGTYQLVCRFHEQLGMKGKLEVS